MGKHWTTKVGRETVAGYNESRALRQKFWAERATRIKKLLDDGETAAVICQRIGIRSTSYAELRRMAGI